MKELHIARYRHALIATELLDSSIRAIDRSRDVEEYGPSPSHYDALLSPSSFGTYYHTPVCLLEIDAALPHINMCLKY